MIKKMRRRGGGGISEEKKILFYNFIRWKTPTFEKIALNQSAEIKKERDLPWK